MAKELKREGNVIHLDNGETLYDPTDFASTRRSIFDTAKTTLGNALSVTKGAYKISVENLAYDKEDDFSIIDERKALLNGNMLGRRLRGNVVLSKDDVPIETKTVTLMNVPYLTDRGTFIHGGNDYGRVSQFRLQPGAYSRVKASGDLEVQINPRTGSGRSMKLEFNPESANYYLHAGGRKIHAYSLFKALGKSDSDLVSQWGDDVTKANASNADSRALSSAYEILVRAGNKVKDPTEAQMREAVAAALNSSLLHKDVVATTLPELAGGVMKTAYLREIRENHRLIRQTPFEPDFEAVKLAMEDFSPDLNADDMQPAHEAIYARTRPQLASMRAWPSEWMGENQLGWIDWYQKYANGIRTADDERQKRRWQLFKARHGALFRKKPTPKAAFALRYWAIDPLKLLSDQPQAQAKLKLEMDSYEQEQTRKFEEQKRLWQYPNP